jgi:DNA-binding PadR family transcriptional regulator
MNELDLTIFRLAHDPITIKELYDRIQKEMHLTIAQKAVYTSIYRLEKQGFITKGQQGKLLLIKQSSQPVSSYLYTLIENQLHLVKEQVFTTTSLNILLSILHKRSTVRWIKEINQLSERNTRRYLSKLHKAAVITKHQDNTATHICTWGINTLQRELLQFLGAYEEFRALKIIESIDNNGSLIWVQGIEFLIKTQRPLHHKYFIETGATALDRYGMKLLPTEHAYLFTRRSLDLWDHAFLTVLSRKNDTNQLRYLAYLYKKHKPDLTEFMQKGIYYDPQSMNLVLDLFTKNKETPKVTMQDIKELENLYGT